MGLEQDPTAATRQREAQLHTLIECLPQRIFFKDRHSVFMTVNAAFAADCGLKPEQLVGRSDLDFFPKELAEKYREDDRRIMAQGHPETIEEANLVGNRLRTVRVTKSPVRDAAGEVCGLLGVFTDITAERETAEALERQRQMLQALMENVPDRVFFKDRESRFICASRSLVKRQDLASPEDIVGKTDFDFLPEAEARELFEEEQEVMRTGQALACKVQRLSFKDGSTQWSAVSKTPVLDSRGVVTGLIGISHDITDLKRAEEELKRSQAFLESVIQNLPIMVFIKDADLRFVLWNKAGEELTGHSREVFLGKTDRDFFPPAEAEFFTAKDREAMNGGRVVDIPEETLDTPHQGTRILHTKKVPILDEHGQPRYLVGISEDITERKATEEQLKLFAQRLEQSNAELQDFAYVASHDLQEPLRKVRAFGDRLRTKCGPVLGEDGRDYLERMTHAAQRMQTLIDDLLAYSRVSRRSDPFVPVDLNNVVRGVLSDLEARIEQVGGSVIAEPLPILEADPTQMRQLLQNLVGNALKFHRKDVPSVVRIFVREPSPATVPAAGRTFARGTKAGRKRAFCQVCVEDNGIGFDLKYLDRIFAVFQRLHSRQEYEGTGIGLAVCRKIALRHGGDITAQSQPGQGATFIVTLPLQQPDSKTNP
ncbi:MAG: PAS domain-containing protein [Verrucomicrobia bacterium]|nr:PAS domain-containing protein [Verrucomicrobiota bacterium]